MSYVYNKKWRLKNPEKRLKGKKRNYEQTRSNAPNSYERWTEQEEMLILNNDKTDFELHILLGRSVQSIQVKRSNLKKQVII